MEIEESLQGRDKEEQAVPFPLALGCEDPLFGSAAGSYNDLTRMKISSSIREQKFSASSTMAEEPQLLSLRTSGILAAILTAVVFAVYSPALNFQFVLDDHRFVGDPRLRSPGHVWEYFTSYAWAQVPGGPLSFYRPVFVLWLRLNHIFCGASPWGWHLLSIAKHVAVAVLLGLLVWKLLRDQVAALIAGTLFALHPAQTESVAWVTVPDPLMTAAGLGTLLLYLEYGQRVSADNQPNVGKFHKKSRKGLGSTSTGNSSARWMIASAAACLAALMAKETAIVLPAVLFIMTLIMPFSKADCEKNAKGEGIGFRVRSVSALRQNLPFLGVTAVYLFYASML